ncbi:F0F1 ATP synthase subunit B' [Pacificispira sp.]|uniref:F0F1 ATP synthase subunit B family protein n=1 Tax=Pacificispira sp. TaxID=2888761 RepID=UPI003BACF095
MNPITKTGIRIAAAAAMVPALASSALAAEGGASMPQLDFSTYSSQVFWLVVTFAVLFILMWKVAIPRVGEVIEAREQKIRADLERAEQLRTEIEETEQAVEKALADARSEALETLRKAQDKIAADHAKKQEKLDAELAVKISDAEARIEEARKEALASVRDVAEEVAAASIEKLTGASADKGTVSKAIDAVSKGA